MRFSHLFKNLQKNIKKKTPVKATMKKKINASKMDDLLCASQITYSNL